MAIHFAFAASKTPKSVPCEGHSISLLELKDAIAAPLVAALRGKKLREQFDFRIFDADTKEEIVGASARVKRNASVLVKRVPAYVLSQQNQPPVVVSSQGLKAVNKCAENVGGDDGFGEDVYSNFVVSTLTTVSSKSIGKDNKKSSKKEEENFIDGVFREGVSSRRVGSAVSCEDVDEVQKEIRISRIEMSGAWNESVDNIPEELMCTLCKHIMKDPMLIPCCCKSFCHNCIKVVLLEEKKCPNCESLRCSDTNLLPNRHLKSLVDVFFHSNPSESSKGSCSSQTTSSQVFEDDLQLGTSCKMLSNQDTHVSKSIGSGSIGKRKPLIISLSNDSKRTKLLKD